MNTPPISSRHDLESDDSPLLVYDALHHSFSAGAGRSVETLRDIRLSIPPHTFVTLVGASGSGKTTLLNLTAGILESNAGSIRYDAALNLKTDLAYVFQHYTLLPWRTVLKNITFGLQLRGVPTAVRNTAAKEWIDRVGLKGFENAYPHELSGGMRQRAAIAQALAIRPKLLLMDEPFGALDDATRTDLQQMLVNLQAQSNTTILFVTHNIDEAILLADRIVVLSRTPGCILEQIDVTSPKPQNPKDTRFTELFMRIRNLIA